MNRKSAAGNLITFKPVQWVYVMISVLSIGPLSIAAVYSDELYDGYVRTYVAPGVRRRFGFTIERRRMYYRAQALDVFVIEGLRPGGVLAQAGVRNGDVPIGVHHMSDVALYRKLEESREKAVKIRLVDCAEYEGLLKAGDLELFNRGRVVIIPRGE